MLPPLFTPFDAAILMFVRVFAFLGFGLYVAFAFIATRQISVMKRTVITPLSSFVSLLGYAHFLLAIGALIFAVMTLQ